MPLANAAVRREMEKDYSDYHPRLPSMLLERNDAGSYIRLSNRLLLVLSYRKPCRIITYLIRWKPNRLTHISTARGYLKPLLSHTAADYTMSHCSHCIYSNRRPRRQCYSLRVLTCGLCAHGICFRGSRRPDSVDRLRLFLRATSLALRLDY